MRFHFVCREALPPLAWHARLRAGDPEVEVSHGPRVETRADAFVEGAWDGPFEHFGFDDGIANPNIRGYGKGGRDENRLAPGEIVLGYPNEMGRFPPSPTIPPGVGLGIALPDGDFGRNGSYLVVRQLEQRVAAFWRHLLDATGDEQRAVQLAAQMVGRWRNGAPLARYAQEPQRDGAPDDDDFGYAADREGHGCPLGAHVRRSNPRDAVPSMEPEESLAASRRRRLLRRGRTYGEPADGFPLDVKRMAESSDGERGLFFLCFNADLETQFEFIQQSWIGSRKFAGLSNDTDPLLSNPEWPPRKGPTDFTVQQELGSRRYRGLPSFTRVRSIALRWFFGGGSGQRRSICASSRWIWAASPSTARSFPRSFAYWISSR